MSDYGELIRRWAGGEEVDLEQFGGAARFLAEIDPFIAVDPLSVVEVVCCYWAAFSAHRSQSIDILVAAADVIDVEMDAVHDVILADPDVVEVVASSLQRTLAVRADTAGLFGDIASESWTRLALGRWCSSYELRDHLQRRVANAGSDVSIHLVRSVAAAVARWDDEELLPTLESLADLDEFRSDVDFELAMRALGNVAASRDAESAVTHLRAVLEHLQSAERDESRADAMAYLGPVRALLRFIDGGAITDQDVAAAREHVNDYLSGYRGLGRHWRQGYADISDGWAHLAALLSEASKASDAHWFAPIDIIDAAGRLYVAETSIELTYRDGRDAANRGIATLLHPQLVERLSAHPPARQFLDTWLEHDRPDRSPSLVEAVRSLRDAVATSPAPKGEGGSGRSPDSASIGTAIGPAEVRPRSFVDRSHVVLTRRIIDEIAAIVPDHARAHRLELNAVVSEIVRFTAHALDGPQTGPRALPFARGARTAGNRPAPESDLADSLCCWLIAAGLPADTETQAAGGRADIRIDFAESRFYIEVKRTLTFEDNTAALAHYGDQATQYAGTTAPIAFLALLDLSHRETRLDLPSVIWTAPHRLPDTDHDYALTGIRIQANTATPSASSRRRRRT